MMLSFLGFSGLLIWSAAKAKEHGLMPPAPKAMRAREEKRNRSCIPVGPAQTSPLWQSGGLACLMIAVSHNKISPCNLQMHLLHVVRNYLMNQIRTKYRTFTKYKQ